MAAIEQAIRVGSYIFESAQDNLTAAGSNQATAFIIGTQVAGSEISRFTTVAAGTGAQLPPAQPGMTLLIVNSGANPLQVFGNGADTINGIAGATGVPQMASSSVFYICISAGAWFTEGLGTGVAAGSIQTLSSANNLTAAGSVQGQATAITTALVEFGTVAASTGAILPSSAPGLEITVVNNGANVLKVYPTGTDAINALGTSAAFSMSSAVVTIFYCMAAGQWWTK